MIDQMMTSPVQNNGPQSLFFLSARNIVKTFSSVIANNGANIDVKKKTMHALVGENGAGKTTLMNVLMGIYKPDEGEILIEGKPAAIKSPRDSVLNGIMMVHQHCSLIGTLDGVENLLLCKDFSKEFIPRVVEAGKSLDRESRKLRYKLDFNSVTELLPYEDRKKLEIVRALCNKIKLLILDEPTSMLTPQDCRFLYKTLRELISEIDMGVLYSTHKLSEVQDFADVVTVLRNGKSVFTKPANSVTVNELVRAMVGVDVPSCLQKHRTSSSTNVLSVRNLSCKNDQGKRALEGLGLEVKEGEIIGIAGATLSGKMELAEVIVGLRKAIGGSSIEIGNRDFTNAKTGDIIKYGVSYLPSGAHIKVLVPDFTVAENTILNVYTQEPFSKRELLNISSVNEYGERIVKEFDVKTPGVHTPARLLSGGNIQKLLLGREFSRKSLKLLIMVNPTSGLDVMTTMKMWQRILELKEKGAGIVAISEDLNELQQISDNIMVLFNGKAVGTFRASEITVEEIGYMILTGEKKV